MKGTELSLASVHVPLESIKPSRCQRLGAGREARATHGLEHCVEWEGWIGTGSPCWRPLESAATPFLVLASACEGLTEVLSQTP